MGKTLIDISAEVLIFLQYKLLNLNGLFSFELDPKLAFQLNPTPFKRDIAFGVSLLKNE